VSDDEMLFLSHGKGAAKRQARPKYLLCDQLARGWLREGGAGRCVEGSPFPFRTLRSEGPPRGSDTVARQAKDSTKGLPVRQGAAAISYERLHREDDTVWDA
jgi:hypothetical protein